MDHIIANIDNVGVMTPIIDNALYNKWSKDFLLKPGILDKPELFLNNNVQKSGTNERNKRNVLDRIRSNDSNIETKKEIKKDDDNRIEIDTSTPSKYLSSINKSIKVNKDTGGEVNGLKSYSNLLKGMNDDVWNIDVCRFLSYHTNVVFIYRKKEVCECDPRPENIITV